MEFSFKKGIFKGLKYAAIFLVAGLIIGLPPEWKELTIGGLLVLLLNWLKVKVGFKLP